MKIKSKVVGLILAVTMTLGLTGCMQQIDDERLAEINTQLADHNIILDDWVAIDDATYEGDELIESYQNTLYTDADDVMHIVSIHEDTNIGDNSGKTTESTIYSVTVITGLKLVDKKVTTKTEYHELDGSYVKRADGTDAVDVTVEEGRKVIETDETTSKTYRLTRTPASSMFTDTQYAVEIVD